VAQTRLLVPRSRYDEISERITAWVAELKVGDALDPATNVGPLVTKAQQQRSFDYIRLGQEEGAKLLIGGGRPASQPKGWFVEPTLFGEVDNGLIPYGDESEAVKIANDSDYGLSGSVWTADQAHGVEIARQVRTGNCGINAFGLDFYGPFGGYKDSGLGREFGPEGLRSYVEEKTMILPKQA
jgi:acyl-CoA reductase-like NAD-dependent aldehyde dehydrogenase